MVVVLVVAVVVAVVVIVVVVSGSSSGCNSSIGCNRSGKSYCNNSSSSSNFCVSSSGCSSNNNCNVSYTLFVFYFRAWVSESRPSCHVYHVLKVTWSSMFLIIRGYSVVIEERSTIHCTYGNRNVLNKSDRRH